MNAVLDAGALVAVDKGDRAVGAMLRVLQRNGVPVTTSGGVVAQVWRDGSRQANLARVLSGVEVNALDDVTARRVGQLLRQNRSHDIVDAHIALLAQPDSQLITSDEPDIKALLRTRKVRARIIPV